MVTDITRARRAWRLVALILTASLATATGAWTDEVPSLRHYLRQTWQTAEGLPQNSVRAIVQTREGYLWFATAEGLVRFDGLRFTIFDRRSTPVLPVRNLQAGHQTLYTTSDGLPSNDVTALSRGRDGAIWIGLRSGGVARFRDNRFESFTGADGLPDDFVRVVYEDQERNVWVGTNSGGVSRLHRTPFRTVGKRDGLPADVIRAVFESQDGSMWVATHAQGLARIHDGMVTQWTTREGLPSDSVAMIGQSRDGAMWVGTREGLVRRSGQSVMRYTTAEGLPHANVRGFFEDRDGGLWISTQSGVCRIDGTRCVPVDGLNVHARGFHQSSDGALWIASNRGLFRYHHGTTTHWGAREGLSSDFLTSIAAEFDGTLWLSTSGAGLNRFKDGRITTYGLTQGLYDETIFRVLSDGLGWIWMTCNRGVFRVPRAELDAIADGRARTVHSQAYTEVDGLRSSRTSWGTR